MRVLHIGKFYPPFAGGIENFLGDLLPALRRIGVESIALVHDHRFGRRHVRCQGDSFGVVRVPCYGTFLYSPLSPSFPLALETVVRRFSPDLLHFHLPNTSAFWALAAPGARKVPWVTHWHADVVASDVDKRLALAYAAYRPMERLFLNRTDAVVTTSHPYLESSKPLKRCRSKCSVVPLGVDEARLPQPSCEERCWADAKWGEDRLRVLAVGRLTYYKGHDVLIRAAALSCTRLRVFIVGQGDRYRILEQMIRQLNLGDRVELLGRLDAQRLRALLATCDCLCLPSVERTEAFGLVLLEAMRYGKPAVVADVTGSGMGWVVKHETSGLLAKSGDHQALAAAIDRFAREQSLKKKMGIAAKERFASEFSIHRVADRIHRIYLSIIPTN